MGVGLYMYDVVVKKFTFTISSPDEFLLWYALPQSTSPFAKMVTVCVLLLSFSWCHFLFALLSKNNLTNWLVNVTNNIVETEAADSDVKN